MSKLILGAKGKELKGIFKSLRDYDKNIELEVNRRISEIYHIDNRSGDTGGSDFEDTTTTSYTTTTSSSTSFTDTTDTTDTIDFEHLCTTSHTFYPTRSYTVSTTAESLYYYPDASIIYCDHLNSRLREEVVRNEDRRLNGTRRIIVIR